MTFGFKSNTLSYTYIKNNNQGPTLANLENIPSDATVFTFAYEGVSGTVYNSSPNLPVNAGDYKCTVTTNSAADLTSPSKNFSIDKQDCSISLKVPSAYTKYNPSSINNDCNYIYSGQQIFKLSDILSGDDYKNYNLKVIGSYQEPLLDGTFSPLSFDASTVVTGTTAYSISDLNKPPTKPGYYKISITPNGNADFSNYRYYANGNTTALSNSTYSSEVDVKISMYDQFGNIPVNISSSYQLFTSYIDTAIDTSVVNVGYVDRQIANLANSAPSTLNAIATIANAIDNDPNFAVDTINSINSAFQVEQIRAKVVESVLSSALSSETVRAEAEESVLSSALSSETVRAEAEESVLSSALSSETVRAEAEESVLSSALSSETVRAEAEESVLSSALSSEIVRAEAEESVLSTAIANLSSSSDSDSTRAKGEESILSTAISSETVRAEAEESVLSSAISDLSSKEYGKQSLIGLGNPYTNESDRINNSFKISENSYLYIGDQWRIKTNNTANKQSIVFEYSPNAHLAGVSPTSATWLSNLPVMQRRT